VNVEVPTIVVLPAMEILEDDPTNVALLVMETLMDEETLIPVVHLVTVTLMTAEKSRREHPATEIQVNAEGPTTVAPPVMEILEAVLMIVAPPVTETREVDPKVAEM